MTTERAVLNRLIRAALAANYSVTVWDGEAYAIRRSTDFNAIVAECGQSDEGDLLTFRHADSGERVGSVLLVWGNGAEELIADYRDDQATGLLVAAANRYV